MSAVASALRTAIKDRHIRTLAEAADIHRVNLHQFRAGTRELSSGDLDRLAEAMGLEIVVQLKPKKRK
jgi:hypothetical protein